MPDIHILIFNYFYFAHCMDTSTFTFKKVWLGNKEIFIPEKVTLVFNADVGNP